MDQSIAGRDSFAKDRPGEFDALTGSESPANIDGEYIVNMIMF
jgi:hypothetical protein